MPLLLLAPILLAAAPQAWPPPPPEAARNRPPGLIGPVGPKAAPRRVAPFRIDRKGVFENLLVDADFAEKDAVRIRAHGTVLRNCEIRNGRRDAVEVYADDVLIENCLIHHFLAGTFKGQKDAHGITGRPNRLTIRNCEIRYVSGDSVQFDPGRGPWTDVLIENCVFWTGPLPGDAAGFLKGEQPGENGLDTKQQKSNPRSRMVIRNCVAYGFAKGGQISNMAALNIKDHVEVKVQNCVFYGNEICLRLRGPTGPRGGSLVTAENCFFYKSDVAVRAEDGIKDLKILNPAFGEGVKRRYHHVGGKGPGLEITGERDAPPLQSLLKRR